MSFVSYPAIAINAINPAFFTAYSAHWRKAVLASFSLIHLSRVCCVAEESDDDKTEAPTPHRLEKAREEGQIPRSRELTSLLILLVGVCIIWFGGESLARQLAGMLSAGLHFDHRMVNDPNLILGQIILLIKAAMMALLPLITA
ncbi:flagellar biosynthetic protein FlhB [Salmonella bongori]|nr:flagellar biosynthetic protein FlhB [Salmonella bongori]